MIDPKRLHVLEDAIAVRRARLQEDRATMTGWELAFVSFSEAMAGGMLSEGTAPKRVAALLRHAAAEIELLGELAPEVGDRLQEAAAGIVSDVKSACKTEEPDS